MLVYDDIKRALFAKTTLPYFLHDAQKVKIVNNKAFLKDMTRYLFLYQTAFYFARNFFLKYEQGSFRR